MTAQITKMSFRCELVTIHSKRTFADLISRIEATISGLRPEDSPQSHGRKGHGKASGVRKAGRRANRIRDLLLSRPGFDTAISGNTNRVPFLPVRKCDDRPRSLPIFCTRRSWSTRALLRLANRWRRCSHRHRSTNFVLQPISRNEGFTDSSDIG